MRRSSSPVVGRNRTWWQKGLTGLVLCAMVLGSRGESRAEPKAGRHRVPAPLDHARIEKELRELLHNERLARAQNPQLAKEVIGELLFFAEREQPAQRYVTYGIALDLAVKFFLIDHVAQLLDKMSRYDHVNEYQWREFHLNRLRVSATEPEHFQQFAQRCLELGKRAEEKNRINEATAFATKAYEAAQKSEDPELEKACTTFYQTWKPLRELVEQGPVALEKLRQPKHKHDRHLHCLVGRFYALIEQNWEKAVPHLIVCDNAGYRMIMHEEDGNPTTPEAIRRLARMYRVMAEDEPAILRKALEDRARFWEEEIETTPVQLEAKGVIGKTGEAITLVLTPKESTKYEGTIQFGDNPPIVCEEVSLNPQSGAYRCFYSRKNVRYELTGKVNLPTPTQPFSASLRIYNHDQTLFDAVVLK